MQRHGLRPGHRRRVVIYECNNNIIYNIYIFCCNMPRHGVRPGHQRRVAIY